ncbi:Uma2 family endonuclease [cf. Phormidesmis sp. LEGE 11477]|uniref:Uma2 family endonuclease n=1 Tax=cf. Phormidesmis sp. LEGE 11477 TaxID=1828680 RepID=UPI00188133A7|nr:Uma2 family endonuclease [cf. Phormidesmis sp. LEGE 11477]MBE9062145.1 Uma2 family endonuclease [cf. Phormidesmis sp. LEGE 11477]
MVQSLTQRPISFEAFLDWYPSDGRRYELIEGGIVEVLPTGPREDIGGFLSAELNFEIRRSQKPYSIPRNCLIRPQVDNSGYIPDVVVLDRERLPQELLWPTASVIQHGTTVPLVIEVVSTNWRDDYGHKFVEYEAMGIQEYWIVDFRALGAVRHIGKPKQPTITICQIDEGEYQIQRFTAGEKLVSRMFPQLDLTADAVFAAAG